MSITDENIKTEENMGEDSFEKMFEESVKEFRSGEIVTGHVVQIMNDIVMVDIGYKSEGQVRSSEFMDADGNMNVSIGDEITVCINRIKDSDGYVSLSKKKAEQLKVWDDINEVLEKDTTIKGTVSKEVKGGFYVDIKGLTAFLPGSQADVKPITDLSSFLNKEFDFKIIQHDRRKNNVIVSRRALVEKERNALKVKTLEILKEGILIKGIVKNLTNYGAFIDLGGIDGLLHIGDISWGRINHPSEVLNLGDEIEVKVLKYNKDENEKVYLGLKQVKEDPWEEVSDKFPVGAKVKGKVVNLESYGAFVEIEEGVEGLIHISEMSWTKIKHPSQRLSIGDVVEVVVLDMDNDKRRISLGLKQIEDNPWDSLEEKYPLGSNVKGIVKNVTDFGAFVGIEEGIDGLIHVSDISWKKVGKPSEAFTKGEEVEAQVVSIDKVNQKFSLSTKLLEKNPWEGIEDKFKPGIIVEGTVTSIADFGAFVEIDDCLEGLVHISELTKDNNKVDPNIKVGSRVDVEILNIDTDSKKIGLSIREVLKTEDKEAEAETETEAEAETDTTNEEQGE